MECCDPGLIVSSLPGYRKRHDLNLWPAMKHGLALWVVLLTLLNSSLSVLELFLRLDGFSVAISNENEPKSRMLTFLFAAICSRMNTHNVFHTLNIVLSFSAVKHCF